MTELKRYLDTLEFSKFMPEGKLHEFLDHHGGKVGTVLADAGILTQKMGLYPGTYLRQWMESILQGDLAVSTFGDLKLTTAEDPGLSLPEGHDYRLVVHTSDITRAELVRLPWDYHIYGWDPDGQDVIDAVRASMSIPFFFEPVRFEARATTVEIRRPDGGTISQHYEGGTVTWVDGGMLRNFPSTRSPGWTAGRPAGRRSASSCPRCRHPFRARAPARARIAVGVHCLRTMMNEWDAYGVDEATAARTIFVDNGGLTATQFDLTPDQQNMLFVNGVSAATQFVIEMAEAGGVPRTAEQSRDRISRRSGAARA